MHRKINTTIVVGVALAFALFFSLYPRRRAVTPSVEPAQQTWAVSTAAFNIMPVAAGKLPAADPRQKKPPCDPDLEVALEGLCWIPLGVEKCPVAAGKAFLHEGKCYARALPVQPLPTSGDVALPGIAAPPR